MKLEDAQRVRTAIDVPWDELRHARVLRKIREELGTPAQDEATVAVSAPPRSRRATWIGGLGAAAAAVAVFVFGWTLREEPRHQGNDAIAVIATTAAPPGDDGLVQLGEGSTLEPHADAAFEVLAVREGLVHLRHSRGRIVYRVEPARSGPFIIDADGVRVSVIGTVFTIDVNDASVRVAVARGRVHVEGRGADLFVGAGESISLRARPTAETAPGLHVELPPEPPGQRRPRILTPRPDDPRSAATLFDAAVAARRSGDLAAAARALTTLVDAWPNDARVPTALFLRGRVLGGLRRHAAAARSFERLLSRSDVHPTLVEDALAEAALARGANDDVRGRQHANTYLERFPAGVHVDTMRRLLTRMPATPP